jgi:hypothetical protein
VVRDPLVPLLPFKRFRKNVSLKEIYGFSVFCAGITGFGGSRRGLLHFHLALSRKRALNREREQEDVYKNSPKDLTQNGRSLCTIVANLPVGLAQLHATVALISGFYHKCGH